jgi:acyl-CoA thioester hydrolase
MLSLLGRRSTDVHEKEIEIRWRDVDAYRHVNNAVYLTYLEEARDEWLEGVLGRDSENLWDFVLARVAIDYRSELTQEDDIVVARCGLEAIGTSSFRTKEQLMAPGGRLAAEAEAVIVARNRAAGGARALSSEERRALEAALES